MEPGSTVAFRLKPKEQNTQLLQVFRVVCWAAVFSCAFLGGGER